MQHRLSDISISEMTAICRVCGPVRIKPRYTYTKSGKMIYRCKKLWMKNERKRRNFKAFPYRKYKKTYCELCGFIAIDKAQLDVDHIDGNNNNNDISNLQTLCANCHRLKTIKNKDHIKQK